MSFINNALNFIIRIFFVQSEQNIRADIENRCKRNDLRDIGKTITVLPF